MRDEEAGYDSFFEVIDNPDHDGGIRTAVRIMCTDPATAKARFGPIASWDVSEVTDVSKLFLGHAGFNEDLSRWNVSNVEYMGSMFAGATSFNGDLSRWEVGQVKDMCGMFYGATSFNGDLSLWDIGQVKSMYGMFQRATSFTRQLDGAWSASTAVKLMMFDDSPGTIAGRTKLANGTIE